jgi:hypothetical protein
MLIAKNRNLSKDFELRFPVSNIMLMVLRVYGASDKRQKKPTLVLQFTPCQHGLAVCAL